MEYIYENFHAMIKAAESKPLMQDLVVE